MVGKELLDTPFNQESNGRGEKRLQAIRNVTNGNPFGVSDRNIQYLSNYLAYISEQGVRVTIVIPPMMENTSQLFLESQIGAFFGQLEASNSARIINTNLYQTYPPEAFWDGTHLNPYWQDIYLHQIEELFGPVLSQEAIVGVDELAPPVVSRLNEFYYRSGRKIIRDGEIGIVSKQIDVPVYIPAAGEYCISARVVAKDGYSNSVFMSVNLAKNEAWHFNNHAEDWQWVTRKSTINLPAGLSLIRFSDREGTPLSAVRVEKCDGLGQGE